MTDFLQTTQFMSQTALTAAALSVLSEGSIYDRAELTIEESAVPIDTVSSPETPAMTRSPAWLMSWSSSPIARA